MKNSLGKKAVLTALFAALTSAGCFIQIPLPGGIPIIIQDMMAMLCGLLLGPVYGGISVLLFLVLGSIGLPVFSGKAGINVILQGPTGGFLIGYLAAAITGGLIVQFLVKDDFKMEEMPDGSTVKIKNNTQIILNWIFIAVAATFATVLCFVLGCLGFHRVKPDLEFNRVLAAVVLPFIPGNTVKLIAMVLVTKKIRPVIRNYLA